jgi:hypothetical protein
MLSIKISQIGFQYIEEKIPFFSIFIYCISISNITIMENFYLNTLFLFRLIKNNIMIHDYFSLKILPVIKYYI